MAKRGLSVNIQIDGLKETLKAFRHLPKEATAELRDAATKVSQKIADKAKAAGRADSSPQSALVAPTVKAKRDRVPVVQAGGASRVGRNRVPVHKVLFGSEFGSNRFSQFHRPHQGRQGAWFFPVVEDNAALIDREWNEAADTVVRRFSAGGA